MRKLTAILLMFAFAQLFSVPPVHAQQVVYARFIRSAAPSLPVFADYPTCGFSTSCTDTVAAGDLVVMMGSAIIQGNITSYAVSSSPSATWNCLPLLGSSSELCWAIMVSSGSTTFTMTPTPSATYATIQIMHYTGGTGHTAQTNASATGSGTTGLFSTTTPTLTVVFAAGGTGTWTAGTVGGNAATNFHACSIGYGAAEDYTTNSSLTNATAVINGPSVAQIQAISFQ